MWWNYACVKEDLKDFIWKPYTIRKLALIKRLLFSNGWYFQCNFWPQLSVVDDDDDDDCIVVSILVQILSHK